MPDTPQLLADHLHSEGGRVVEFFNQLSEEQWNVRIYPQDGDWCMHELLAHIVSAEIGRKDLILSIAMGGKGAPPGFDIDQFNQDEVEKLSRETDAYLLELFSQQRDELSRFVSKLEVAYLERMGNDPFLGKAPLIEVIRLTYIHLQIHLRDARRRL
ncbi:MAG TPA: DinB family protein [Anaerolineales bacterium]